MNRMLVQDASGHTEVAWSPDVAEQVETAAEQFARMVNDPTKQVFAFPVAGEPGEVVTRETPFDPSVQKYLVTPRAAGG